MLSKLFWKISAAMFIGFGILLTGCAKDDPSSEEVNAVIAERLDLTEEQAARVQPVTAEILAERETFRTLRTGLYEDLGSAQKCIGCSGGITKHALYELESDGAHDS